MNKQEAEAETPAWFAEGGNVGQDEAVGEELAVDDGEVLEEEVAPAELQPPNEDLKTKDEKPARPEFKIPRAEAASRRAPPWAKVPKGMRFPRGINVLFFRIRADITMFPKKGDRQVIAWALTDGDERIAIGRSMGNGARASIEMAKQMIRAIDGEPVNWTGDPSAPGCDIDSFWNEIGPKGRNLIVRLFTQIHAMNDDELSDFFESCIGVVSTG